MANRKKYTDNEIIDAYDELGENVTAALVARQLGAAISTIATRLKQLKLVFH